MKVGKETTRVLGRGLPASGLPKELQSIADEIALFARDCGLDFSSVVFEVVDFEEMNEVASYGGFPTRYPHWRFGMEFEELKKGYAYGLHKIYELVINNDPCYAYLLQGNSLVDQKIVMAHVYAHADFFKNNLWFSQTNRRMIDEIANHGTRIRKYQERFGVERVEEFVDKCLSVENLIDYHSLFAPRKVKKIEVDVDEEIRKGIRRIPGKDYMERFINPPEFIELQRKKLEDEVWKRKKFPEQPETDILMFLIEYAPLEPWQRDILSIVREESYYFGPQALTKIMNEGWASYWHSRIMTEKICSDAEIIDYADHHSGTLGARPGVVNPYKMGLELFRTIEDRWNRGKFGKEYDECADYLARRSWDRKVGLGREKIFEVRKIYNDITFIDEFFTEEFCEEQQFFAYEYDSQKGVYEIADRSFEKVKKKLLFQLTNAGHPRVRVEDANYANRGELYLMHVHEGYDLDIKDAKDTVKHLHAIWNRPVHIQTSVEGRGKLISFDGEKFSETSVS